MRINYESWWKSKNPDYPHTVLTEIFDPCKVQAYLPEVNFVSVGVLSEDRPTMRIWGFRTVADMNKFCALDPELLRVKV